VTQAGGAGTHRHAGRDAAGHRPAAGNAAAPGLRPSNTTASASATSHGPRGVANTRPSLYPPPFCCVRSWKSWKSRPDEGQLRRPASAAPDHACAQTDATFLDDCRVDRGQDPVAAALWAAVGGFRRTGGCWRRRSPHRLRGSFARIAPCAAQSPNGGTPAHAATDRSHGCDGPSLTGRLKIATVSAAWRTGTRTQARPTGWTRHPTAT